MTDYTQVTNFTAKDSLPSGDPDKVGKGSDIDGELSAISTAITSKADSASPTFTGTVTVGSTTIAGNTTVSGNNTHSGTNTFSGATTFTADPTISSTDAGATVAPILNIDRNSASPAASDVLGAVDFLGRDSGANSTIFARVQGEIVDPTDTSEDGKLAFQTPVAGTLATRGYVAQGLVMGSPTGGDPGAGKINATGVQVNGTDVDGMVLISSATASSSASIEFTNLDTTYRNYLLVVSNSLPATSGVTFLMHVTTDGGSSWDTSANYGYSYDALRFSGGSSLQAANGATMIQLTLAGAGHFQSSVASEGGWSGHINIYNPANGTTRRPFSFVGTYGNNAATDMVSIHGSAVYFTTTAIDGVRFTYSTGNIASGEFKLYGLKGA